MFINSFDALGRLLKFNGIKGFEDLSSFGEDTVKAPAAAPRSPRSLRSSVMGINDKLEDLQPALQIDEKLQFDEIVTAKQAFEYSIIRAREMIAMTADEFRDLQREHPEMFLPPDHKHELALVKMCQKKGKEKQPAQPQIQIPAPILPRDNKPRIAMQPAGARPLSLM